MKVRKIGFLGTTAAFLLSALTPLAIPFAVDGSGNLTGVGYAAGGIFWLGLVLGLAGYLLLAFRTKGAFPKSRNRRLPSGLYFCSNRPAIAADAALAVGLVTTIVCAVNIRMPAGIAMAGLVLVLAGVYAHFLFNGKLYEYIWNRPKGHQQKSETKERKE